MAHTDVRGVPRPKKEIISLTDCFVCKQPFTEPKLLPCLHTFCLTCLEKNGAEARSGDKMSCPLCAELFYVPTVSTGGFASLKSNFFVEKLLEINKISVCAVKPCQICMDKNKSGTGKRDSSNNFSVAKPPTPNKRLSTVHARFYCADCEQNFCSDCANTHTIHCKDHKLITLESPSPMRSSVDDTGPSSRFRPHFCDQHKNEKLRWHCSTCAETVCTLCRENNHRNHTCNDVTDVLEKFRKQLQADMDKVAERIPERLQARKDVDQHTDKFHDKVQNLTLEIAVAGERLKQQVDQMTRALTDNLTTVHQQFLKELEKIGSGIDRDVSILEGFRDYTGAVKEKGTPCDVSRSVTDISEQANKLSSQKFSDCSAALSSFDVKFEKTVKPLQKNINDFENLVGRTIIVSDTGLVVTNTHLNGFASDDVKARRVARLETDKRYVTGLGLLENRLYVICGCSNSIRVYDVIQNYKQLNIIKLPKLKDPADLACCPSSNCLYVTDSGNSCVWRVAKLDKKGLGGKVDKWLSNIGWPYKISVSQGGRILIISWSPSALSIYSSDAARQRTITLPADLVEPQNAVETSRGTFIVTHGWTNSQVHQVVELDQDGQLLNKFGEGTGSNLNQFDLPSHIALDHLGRIFVADYNNSRVMLLTGPLRSSTRSQVLVSWSDDSMKEPRRIAFAPNTSAAAAAVAGSSSSGFLKSGDKFGKVSPGSSGHSVSAAAGSEIGVLYVGLGGAVDVYSLCQ